VVPQADDGQDCERDMQELESLVVGVAEDTRCLDADDDKCAGSLWGSAEFDGATTVIGGVHTMNPHIM
jgi:hypothetical protein